MTRERKIHELACAINLLNAKVEKEHSLLFKPAKEAQELVYNMLMKSKIAGLKHEIKCLRTLLKELKVKK